MDEQEIKRIIEALLMSAEGALSLDQIHQVFDDWQKPERALLKKLLHELGQDYQHSAFELVEVASGYLIQTKKKYSHWINRMNAEKPSKYSRAFLETLAIIAYRQPVTRADIEEIRGVAVSTSILKTLLEREWVKVAGHRDVPGKPAVYVTTKAFLDYFNLNSLEQLPLLPLSQDMTTEQLQVINECINA